MIERENLFMGKRVNTPFGPGMITVMPYNEHTDTVFVELDRPTFDYFPKDIAQKFVVVSFNMMQEPEYAPVPEKIRENKAFRYQVYRFVPAGSFADFGIKDDFFSITKSLTRDEVLALWNKRSCCSPRPEDQPRFEWNHEDFYSKTDDKEADVFYCIETAKFYVPCENELFKLKKEHTSKWLNTEK